MDRRAAIGRALRSREPATPNPAFLSLTDDEQINGLALFGAEEPPSTVATVVPAIRAVKQARPPALPEPGNVLVWQVPALAAMLVAAVAVFALISAVTSSDRPVSFAGMTHDVVLTADEPIRPRMPIVTQTVATEPPRVPMNAPRARPDAPPVRPDPPVRLAAFSTSRPVEPRPVAPRPASAPAIAPSVENPVALPGSLAAEPRSASAVAAAVPAPVPPPVSAAPPRAESVRPVVRPPAPENAVQTVLARYRDAYDDLDAGAARAIWPSVDHKALSKAFERLEHQQLIFDSCDISVTDARAVASCRGVASYIPRVGNKARRDDQRAWEFTLSRVNDAWLIDTVSAR